MNGENEYVPTDQAIELLGEKPEKFYYHSGRGEIRTEIPARPGKGKKNNRYLVSDILALRKRLVEQRQKRKPEPIIDWLLTPDLAAGIALAEKLYHEDVDLASAAVYQGWRKNNAKITLAAFSPDRSECYASIQIVPLISEQIALDVLSNRRSENSILPDEIPAYDKSGPYVMLGTSALCLPSRPELLLKLLRSYMKFWEEQYPERYMQKIYAQTVSETGYKLAQHLFMAPRPDLAYNAYELDLARPSASRLINQFKQRLADIAPLPPELQWPPVVQPHALVAEVSHQRAGPTNYRAPDLLAPGSLHIKDFLSLHNLKSHRRKIIGYLDVESNGLRFRSFPKPNRPGETDRYLDPLQQDTLLAWLHVHHPDVFTSAGED